MDARYLTSYQSDCEVSKKVKTLADNQAHFAELEKTQKVLHPERTSETRVFKPFR